MKRLEGKIAIITGASAGIGKASALLFASEGASLGLIDINLDGGKEVCEEIRKNGGKAEFFGIDVSNPEAMKGAFEAVADTYGGIGDGLAADAPDGMKARLAFQGFF